MNSQTNKTKEQMRHFSLLCFEVHKECVRRNDSYRNKIVF